MGPEPVGTGRWVAAVRARLPRTGAETTSSSIIGDLRSAASSVIGVVGDPHAEDDLLQRALELIEGHTPDVTVCTGDVVDGPGDVERTVRLLQEHQVVTVAGNHDRWLLTGQLRDLPDATRLDDLSESARRWLAELPTTRTLPTVVGDLLLCHGVGADDMNKLRADDYGYSVEQNDTLLRLLTSPRPPAVLLKGHTHRGGTARFGVGLGPGRLPSPRVGGELLMVDAGSLRADHGPSCAVLDLRRSTVTRYDLATGTVRQEDLPGRG